MRLSRARTPLCSAHPCPALYTTLERLLISKKCFLFPSTYRSSELQASVRWNELDPPSIISHPVPVHVCPWDPAPKGGRAPPSQNIITMLAGQGAASCSGPPDNCAPAVADVEGQKRMSSKTISPLGNVDSCQCPHAGNRGSGNRDFLA